MSGFAQILEDLNRAEIRYVLVGGIALIRHGVVRATRDLDAVVDPDAENLRRIQRVIKEWAATRPDGSPISEPASDPRKSIHLATPHGEVDLLSELTAGIDFEGLLSRSDIRKIDGVEAPVCSLLDLVTMKRNVGRERDLADLSDLEAAHGELPET